MLVVVLVLLASSRCSSCSSFQSFHDQAFTISLLEVIVPWEVMCSCWGSCASVWEVMASGGWFVLPLVSGCALLVGRGRFRLVVGWFCGFSGDWVFGSRSAEF